MTIIHFHKWKILFFLALLCYFLVPFVFFQQDELYGISQFIGFGNDILFHRFPTQEINHFVPLSRFLGLVTFNIFGLNTLGYSFAGIVIHLLNAYLIYLLANDFFNDKRTAFIVTVIFVTSGTAAEIVMWPVVNLNMLALTTVLLSFITILKMQRSPSWILGILASLLVLAASLIIEYAVAFFVFLPLFYFLIIPKRKFKYLFQFTLPVTLTTIIYFYFRFASNIGMLNDGGVRNLSELAFLFLGRLFVFPIKYIGQIFVGQPFLRLINNIVGDKISLLSDKNLELVDLLSGFIILIIFFKWFTNTTARVRGTLILLFLAFSSIPFIAVGGVADGITIFSPRHLYFGLAGFSLAIGLFHKAINDNKRVSKIIWLVIILYVVTGIVSNIGRASQLVQTGNERRYILNEIKSTYPLLPKRVVFYINSSQPYYGLSESDKILPFQSGFGHTLMIWYKDQNIPREFYQKNFLWDITTQDYQEIDGLGFGYFREIALLKEAVAIHNLDATNILSFYWDGENKKLMNQTEEIREIITNEDN